MPGPGLPAASVWALAPQYYCLEMVGEEQLQGAFSYSGGHTADMQWSSNPWPEIIQQAETSNTALTGILLSGPPSPSSRATFRGPEALAFQAATPFLPLNRHSAPQLRLRVIQAAHPSAPNHSFALWALSLCYSFILVLLLPTHPSFSPSSQENR